MLISTLALALRPNPSVTFRAKLRVTSATTGAVKEGVAVSAMARVTVSPVVSVCVHA